MNAGSSDKTMRHDHGSPAGHDHDDHGHCGHDHSGHDHAAFGHSHAPTSFGLAFAVAVVLNAGIVVAELAFGLLGHSVALIADAGHNLADVLALIAAYAAHALGRRAPSARFTYGLGGTSILAAVFNAAALLLVTGALSWEAILRFANPEPVAASVVMAVAGGAIVVNGASAYLLSRGHAGDLNVRASALHLAADAGVAAGVVVGALLIMLTGWSWIDPMLSLFINVIIVLGAWSLLREALSMSLAGVPRSIDHAAVRGYLAALPGVEALHDLHIWSMSTSETALTAHLVMPGGHPGDAFLMQACDALRQRYAIGHTTMQIETDAATRCALAPEHVV